MPFAPYDRAKLGARCLCDSRASYFCCSYLHSVDVMDLTYGDYPCA